MIHDFSCAIPYSYCTGNTDEIELYCTEEIVTTTRLSSSLISANLFSGRFDSLTSTSVDCSSIETFFLQTQRPLWYPMHISPCIHQKVPVPYSSNISVLPARGYTLTWLPLVSDSSSAHFGVHFGFSLLSSGSCYSLLLWAPGSCAVLHDIIFPSPCWHCLLRSLLGYTFLIEVILVS